MGWAKCYWCPYWTYNPYIHDSLGGQPLCDMCFDWFIGGGGPYEPSKLTKTTRRIEFALCLRSPAPRLAPAQQLNPAVTARVAGMLAGWWEPGEP